MTMPAWIVKLAAAAMFPAVIGMGAAFSAPSPEAGRTGAISDEAFRPGDDGVDYAAMTGEKGSETGKLPACADPSRRGDLRPCL